MSQNLHITTSKSGCAYDRVLSRDWVSATGSAIVTSETANVEADAVNVHNICLVI